MTARIFILLSLLLSIVLSTKLSIKQSAAQANQSLAVHVHGLAEITVAVDQHHLEIELISPAVNLVGFEHQAHSAEEIALVNRAQSMLSRADLLFSLPDAKCTLVKHATNLSSLIPESAVSPDNTVQANTVQPNTVQLNTVQTNTIQHNTHAHESSHQTTQKHPLGNNAHHSEVTANYLYHCEKPLLLVQIKVNALDVFTELKKVKVMWINNSQQGAITLDRHNNVINLR